MENRHAGEKRKREEQSAPWQKHPSERGRDRSDRSGARSHNKSWQNDQVRLNQIQEDERMREWVAQEDDFVLRQSKKKAEIRVREGRANPIDWLAVTLRPIDTTRNLLDEDVDEAELDFMHPDAVFDDLSEKELDNLRKDIDTYLKLETNSKNRDYWKTLQILCKDRRRKLRSVGPEGRAVNSVSSDIDRLLGPKSYDELESLEKQIRTKLDSNEPIDTDYWQQLLDSLLVWKAKAKIKKLYQAIVDSRVQSLRADSEKQATSLREAYTAEIELQDASSVFAPKALDPEPLLQLDTKDKALGSVDETAFLQKIASDRRRITKLGYVPAPKSKQSAALAFSDNHKSQATQDGRFDRSGTGNDVQANKSLYEREVAKGVGEDEEVFAGEEQVETKNKDIWMGKYRPRKPKYFNRVQMGYEWNKYNQTHYDHDNPPPKVVQGYKFHIFYPDLIDTTKAPTFKIIREGGRKKGQSIAPAGEEDTCIIRFMAGPPYEDIAFRIVDRDWDYSAKHDRGFKSTFEKGILTLHFSFKKIFYRK